MAAGDKLSLAAGRSGVERHAIAVPHHAEDHEHGFRRAGQDHLLVKPGGPGIRWTPRLRGYSVPPFYDSMIGS